MRSPFAFDWVLERADAAPDAAAIGTPDGWVSYGDLAARVAALAATLRASGVGTGDFVLVALPHLPAAAIATLAAQAVGACAVEVNREWGAEGISRIAAQLTPRAAVLFGADARAWRDVALPGLRFFALVHRATPPARMVEAFGKGPAHHIDEGGALGGTSSGALAARDFARDDPEAPALLVYTSGSTGEPRGVVQTHANVHANTDAIAAYLALTAADRAMAILPLYYCYGRSVLQTHLYVGGSVFLDHRFMYPRVVMEAIGAERCTGFAGVPLTFELLRRQVNLASLSLETLRYVTQAGGALAPETLRWARGAFAPARLFVMYGQAEATARLTYLPPERAADKEGSVGVPVRGVTLRVVDDAGEPLPPGQLGHVQARGPSITAGYYGAEAESADVRQGEWLKTGDLGHLDAEGFLYLRGRAKEILKVGGHRVSTVEIEQELARHPDVHEAAVVGIPDDLDGEAPVAFVVTREGGAPLSDAELKKHCRARLAPYKIPKFVHFVEALPRTGAGKVEKGKLSAMARDS